MKISSTGAYVAINEWKAESKKQKAESTKRKVESKKHKAERGKEGLKGLLRTTNDFFFLEQGRSRAFPRDGIGRYAWFRAKFL